jgi:uncharacterized protein YdeI (YjbR/CyaY-like superfamily)
VFGQDRIDNPGQRRNPMKKANPKVDWFFDKAGTWQHEVKRLRTIALDCGLAEVLKWGCPCYALEGRNVVLIHTFKEYCAFLFFKGALLKDPKKILIQQTRNVQAARQIRFTNTKEIDQLKSVLKAYIKQAIVVEKAGLKVTLKKPSDFLVASEFQHRLNGLAALKDAFDGLTPGRQKGYLLYFSSAKKSETREARVEKCIPRILEGRGLED